MRMSYRSIKARREVRFAIVAYCHDLFLSCPVEKTYCWGNYLSPSSIEAQLILRVARNKLGFKKGFNNRDLFWHLQCTWRKMVAKNLIEQYKPEALQSKIKHRIVNSE